MQWTLDQLRQFAAAAEAGSFSAAGRRLGRAQSAISTSVGLLEADLGVELFDRSRRNATLTPAGEVMLQEARELLRQAGALEQRALAFAAGREARLSIALDEGLPYLVADQLLKELAERYPALELTQLNGTATEVAGYVEQGRASLAFQFDRGDPGSAFAHRHLGNVAQGIFVAQGHPLAALAEVGRNDLARHRQLLMQMDGVEQVVLSPSVWRADSSYNIAAMAAHGRGLGHPAAEYWRIRRLQQPARQRALRGPVPSHAVRAHALAAGRQPERDGAVAAAADGPQLLRAGAPAPAGGPGVN
nr:LysR family transcriptional regulator [Achromobacter denitrificans]